MTYDIALDPFRNQNMQALWQSMPLPPFVAPPPTTMHPQIADADAFSLQGQAQSADMMPFFQAAGSAIAAHPELLEGLNQMREMLGLPPFTAAPGGGLQDPAGLGGMDLMALMVMWALSQGQRQHGGGQQHQGLPQQSFSNGQPTSWNNGGGGGGGAPSTGHDHGSHSGGGGGGSAPTAIPSGPVPGLPGNLGPVTAGQNGVPSGLNANAARGAAVVREVFGFDGDIGGLGHRSGPSDHPHGNAIDVMTNDNMQQGQEIGDYFREHHEELGVKYVIFNQRIASPRTGWQWEAMEDRGSPTANHVDHPHISFHGPE